MYLAFILLAAWLYHLCRLASLPSVHPHPCEGPFPLGEVRARPIPLSDALSQNLTGVLVHVEGKVGGIRVTRGGTLLLKVDGAKVVAYPSVVREIALDTFTEARWLSVTGVLHYHPRYGWEVVLRRSSDLKPAQPPF